jgi:hypothetical protein
MAFKTNEFQQMNLFDPVYSMSDRNKAFLKKSWAYGFAEKIFPAINEERFSVLYSDNKASRPNTPANIIIGALLIKELFGLTDEELTESIYLDIRYQYALHTTSLEEQPISDRTFSRFREKVLGYEKKTGIDLIKEEMYSLSEHFLDFLGICPSVKRMDSIMIASSCKTMSRLELFYSCVENAVKALHRLGCDDLLLSFSNYLEDSNKNNVIYRCKPEDAESRLQQTAQDAAQIIVLLNSNDSASELPEISTLIRLLDEQVIISDKEVMLKVPKQITTNSLQNPSDPDASYRFKAGKKHTGYVGNFVETVDENGAIITQFDYQQNIHADHSFCAEVIDEIGMQTNKVTLIADGAYSGLDNVEKAKQYKIELITTALTGPAPSDIHNKFQIDADKHEVICCPMDHKPQYYNHNQKRDDYRITFAKEYCENCPNKDKCKVKIQQKNAVVKLSQDMINRANYIQSISVEEYITLQKKRNGVEGIPSILRRRYNIDRVPVRGYLSSKFWYTMKIGAINVSRMLKVILMQIHFMKLSMFLNKIVIIVKSKVLSYHFSLLLTP